jgi:acyl dehydratase
LPVTEARLEEMVSELRERIGVPVKIDQFNRVATADSIRHFALGYGDDNPLWCDAEYAARSAWGSVIAPPSFILSCGMPRSQGLPGVHGLFAGISIEYVRPIRQGDALTVRGALDSLQEMNGKFAGKTYKQENLTTYSSAGELVVTSRSYSFRIIREAAASKGKYRRLERHQYTAPEIAEIQQQYLAEVEGRQTRPTIDLDTLQVGDRLPALQKGPLTVAEIIAWLIGSGGVYLRSSRQWYQFLERHPSASVNDSYGVPDVPERVHWDNEMATQIGMPGAYDYGAQRVAWLGHILTDWVRDQGWVRFLRAEIRGPNYVGDLTTISGVVSAIDRQAGEVTVDLLATDQRGRTTAKGSGTVVLV